MSTVIIDEEDNGNSMKIAMVAGTYRSFYETHLQSMHYA